MGSMVLDTLSPMERGRLKLSPTLDMLALDMLDMLDLDMPPLLLPQLSMLPPLLLPQLSMLPTPWLPPLSMLPTPWLPPLSWVMRRAPTPCTASLPLLSDSSTLAWLECALTSRESKWTVKERGGHFCEEISYLEVMKMCNLIENHFE